jgi:hypothetical protein
MAGFMGEMWLPLAFLAGFAIAWLWQRSTLTSRIKSLEEELSLCRRRSTEIDNERKQALARIAPRDGGVARAGPTRAGRGHGPPGRINA